jgi:hypothetical protein
VTDPRIGDVPPDDPRNVDDDEPHVRDDLAAGQGASTDHFAIPAEDVSQLAGIRPDVDQDATFAGEGVDRLGEITPTEIYEGELEARTPNSDQPDEPDAANIEFLTETELRDGETDDAGVAAEEGLTWVPPSDPPIVPGDDGGPAIAAGFGSTAHEEPFDQDHHASNDLVDDERTERVLEALRSHGSTAHLVDRLEVETVGSRVIVGGVVDDLVDEDEILAVASDVEGVTQVDSRIEVAALE